MLRRPRRRLWSLMLVFAAAGGCGIGGPPEVESFQARGVAQGPLTIGVWLPAGLDEFRFDATDQDRLLALGINQVEWLQRASVGGSTAEELAMEFCTRNGLSMPVYYEPKGFSPYEKLRNWTTRAKVGASFESDVRARVRALKEQWGPESGFAGYLIGHEDYRDSYYPALGQTVDVLRQEDPGRPAFTVGRLESFPSKNRFLNAFFSAAGPANLFQQEHYIFRGTMPQTGKKLRQKLRELVTGYSGVASHLKGRNARWHAILQAHAEEREHAGVSEEYYRKPTGAELAVQAGAALARGASGIIYFLYSSGTEKVLDGAGEVVQTRHYEGLVNRSGEPTPAYKAARELNLRLGKIGRELAPLYFRGGYSARALPKEDLVAALDEDDIELGFFGDSTGTTHLLLVNMRTSEEREVSLKLNTRHLRDHTAGKEMASPDGRFNLRLEPADIRLLEVN